MPVMRVFEVECDPRGQGRPRARVLRCSAGGKMVSMAQLYKAKEDVAYEKKIRDGYLKTYRICKPLTGAIVVNIIAFFGIPMSTTKKFKESAMAGKEFFVKKPDADNVAKAVLDALNKVAWEDDSQVVKITCQKEYVAKNMNPKLVVMIREADIVGDFGES